MLEERLLEMTVTVQDIERVAEKVKGEEPDRGDGIRNRKVGGSQSLGFQKGSGTGDTEENSHQG